MTVVTTTLFGTPHIGVYVYVNDEVALIPRDAPKKFVDLAEETFSTPVHKVSIARSRLIGVLSAGNSRALVLPSIIYEDELSEIRDLLGDAKVIVLSGIKETTPGNLILANDTACVASSLLSGSVVDKVAAALGVPCIRGEIGGLPLVGAVAVVTNRGLLLPPTASEEEVDRLSEFFGVPADVATVNRGRVFLRSGLVANSHGALAGAETTGHELMKIQQVLFG